MGPALQPASPPRGSGPGGRRTPLGKHRSSSPHASVPTVAACVAWAELVSFRALATLTSRPSLSVLSVPTIVQALRLPDAAVLTAAHLLCQFRSRTNEAESRFPEERLVAACLFLACKVSGQHTHIVGGGKGSAMTASRHAQIEEAPRRISDVLNVVVRVAKPKPARLPDVTV